MFNSIEEFESLFSREYQNINVFNIIYLYYLIIFNKKLEYYEQDPKLKYKYMFVFEVLIIFIPVLLVVAYITIAERKTMASMQRRLGPNIVGYYGLLQAFADALKLILKEYVAPTQSNLILFFIGPIITLIFSLLGYAVIPYGPELAIKDFNLSILYILAVSSLATYGILLAGWSANSKYAFLGSLRSTAQLISYELVLSSAILLIIFLTGNLNLTTNVESQKIVWLLFPLFPILIIFLIGSIAETNRAPFDLAEAESELVSGFMTEHAAVIFVFFFLAEYASIVLMCILISILFMGGYIPLNILNIFLLLNNIINIEITYNYINYIYSNSIIEGIFYGLNLGLKSSIMIFIFIWVRASFPRIRYDQLMAFCWTVLLPILFSLIILIPCILYIFNILIININII
jgi:NADH-ubiquinone oxidoreductase chain 1